MERDIQSEINFGSEICMKLKNIYYPQESWEVNVSDKISKLFSKLKSESYKLFPTDTEITVLQRIAHFSEQDFIELCEMINLR